MYSDIANQASVPVNSRSQMRFSAVVRARVAIRCYNIASGTASVSTLDIAKSGVLGVSKPKADITPMNGWMLKEGNR